MEDRMEDRMEDNKIVSQTRAIVKSLVGLLLDSEEFVGTSQDVVAAAERLTGTLRTLLVFAELDPALLVRSIFILSDRITHILRCLVHTSTRTLRNSDHLHSKM